jgi:Glyoxalase-like domain
MGGPNSAMMDVMAVLDHLVYFVPSLDEGMTWFEDSLGVRPAYGGSHRGRGTHNGVVSLGDAYVELIAPDPDQPNPREPRPFGLDDRTEQGLVTFAVRPGPGETMTDLIERASDAGHDPGEPVEMSRLRPDGVELHWTLTFPTGLADGFIPFFIDWGDTPNPAGSAPSGVRLVDLMGSTSHHERANRVLAALGLDEMAVDGPGGLSAILASADGLHHLVL